MASAALSLESRCDLLRSLHRPGAPLLLPNAWDVASARAVVAAGVPGVATTSWGVAALLGHAGSVLPCGKNKVPLGSAAKMASRISLSRPLAMMTDSPADVVSRAARSL